MTRSARAALESAGSAHLRAVRRRAGGAARLAGQPALGLGGVVGLVAGIVQRVWPGPDTPVDNRSRAQDQNSNGDTCPQSGISVRAHGSAPPSRERKFPWGSASVHACLWPRGAVAYRALLPATFAGRLGLVEQAITKSCNRKGRLSRNRRARPGSRMPADVSPQESGSGLVPLTRCLPSAPAVLHDTPRQAQPPAGGGAARWWRSRPIVAEPTAAAAARSPQAWNQCSCSYLNESCSFVR